MLFRITHTTRYRYARPVCLEPHVLRLRPRADGTQRLVECRIRVQPRPLGWSEGVDLDGNAITHVWFDGLTESLSVVSTATVQTVPRNPLEFLLEPWATTLPLRPPIELASALAPYQLRHDPDESVTQLAAAVSNEVAHHTVAFLTALSRRIADNCQGEVRLEGDPQLPAFTLREGTGACRDLAVLFIDACRALGLPARFVSGYHGALTRADRPYLHAWAEVFLPGAGWRGFDPLQGLAVADRHVPVAASAHPADATPISGTFRGSIPSSNVQVDLEIDVRDGDA